MPLTERIERDFTYQSPSGGLKQKYIDIRAKAKEFALLIAATTPESREQSLAITALEESVMWANAAIARNSPST